MTDLLISEKESGFSEKRGRTPSPDARRWAQKRKVRRGAEGEES